MERRQLDIDSYDAIIAELDRLEQAGYQRAGNWSLGQVCKHLSYYLRGSLEGYSFMLPWIVRKLIGRPMLKRILTSRSMKAGSRTIPGSVFEPPEDEHAAVAEARELVQRLKQADQVHPSPMFGPLTLSECEQLHTGHAAHHLSFLIPQS